MGWDTFEFRQVAFFEVFAGILHIILMLLVFCFRPVCTRCGYAVQAQDSHDV